MAKILLIDDDELFSVAIRCTLEPRGHVVVAVGDGEEGLKRFESDSFDAVICDLILPGLSGTAVIQDIRAQCPDLCIFAISGGCQSEDDEDHSVDFMDLGVARSMGADQVFVKPIRFAHLATSLEAALDDRGIAATA